MLARTRARAERRRAVGHSALRAYVLGDAPTSAPRPPTRSRACRRSCARHGGGRARLRDLALARARRRGRPAGAEPTGDARRAARAGRRDGGGRPRRARDHAGDLPDRRPTSSRSCRSSARETGRAGQLQRDSRPARPRRRVGAGVRAAARGPRAGAPVVPQVSCRPMRFDFDLDTGCASLDALPAGGASAQAAIARRAWRCSPTREFRAAVRAETLERPDSPSSRRWAAVVLEEARDPRIGDSSAGRWPRSPPRAAATWSTRCSTSRSPRTRHALLDAAAQLRRGARRRRCCASRRA